MIKRLASFLYNLFVIDQTTGKISHTKFLAVTAGVVMIGLFPYVVITGRETSAELWLVMGALFLGNRSIKSFIDKKYGTQSSTEIK